VTPRAAATSSSEPCSTHHRGAAGRALFSDIRLALAVVRGSGSAVAQLGALARQSVSP
jgi:glutamate-5-semialdehyde dehydrogenase